MGRGDVRSVRALPRAFVPGVPDPCEAPFELPDEEFRKFHSVLRLGTGDEVALLPGDGRLVRCRLEGRSAVPVQTLHPQTEAPFPVTLALGLPKPEKLEESVRMATELGVAGVVVFPSDRTVVRWEPAKLVAKLDRLRKIAREAAEVSFRTRLPVVESVAGLGAVLERWPEALVLSEVEGVGPRLGRAEGPTTLIVGPEGGWSPREVDKIGSRAVTLGPRVLRVDTAVAAACSLALGN